MVTVPSVTSFWPKSVIISFSQNKWKMKMKMKMKWVHFQTIIMNVQTISMNRVLGLCELVWKAETSESALRSGGCIALKEQLHSGHLTRAFFTVCVNYEVKSYMRTDAYLANFPFDLCKIPPASQLRAKNVLTLPQSPIGQEHRQKDSNKAAVINTFILKTYIWNSKVWRTPRNILDLSTYVCEMTSKKKTNSQLSAHAVRSHHFLVAMRHHGFQRGRPLKKKVNKGNGLRVRVCLCQGQVFVG